MLPLNVKTYLKTSMALEQKKILTVSKGNFQSAGNYSRSVAIKSQDELSPAAARATDKIMMNPTTREGTGGTV